MEILFPIPILVHLYHFQFTGEVHTQGERSTYKPIVGGTRNQKDVVCPQDHREAFNYSDICIEPRSQERVSASSSESSEEMRLHHENYL